MSYALAYTTHFHSLDNTPWEIGIYINGYDARPVEISLDGDEPCVIDWQETDKMDVVQSATCTLRVSNERDRQMVQLMNSTDAAILVSRYGKPYWWGYLDDAVYEEPYSFPKGYVTELPFTDLGALNRIPFTLSGKQSVGAIVRDCLDSIGYGTGAIINLYTSLLDPNTQQPITLDMLYINADRFATDGDSWGKMTMKRDVLEDILRPLGLRIMQKNGQIYIYDIEYLRDNNIYNYVVWKGNDAYLRGSETYKKYDVAFEHDAVEMLAEEHHRFASQQIGKRHFAKYYDEDTNETNEGFYIMLSNGPDELLDPNGRIFRTRSNFTDSDDTGYAWRVRAHDRINPTQIPPMLLDNEIVNAISSHNPNVAVAGPLFKIESGYLPLAPDADKYQLRVNLDLLFSPKLNPFEGDENWNVEWSNTIPDYDNWRDNLLQVYVPVKLELLDEEGNILMHYRNIWRGNFTPLDCGQGVWELGAGDFGDMMLAYYNDGLEQTILDGWATNKQSMLLMRERQPSLYKKRKDGEYVPLPSSPGILRLTISYCVFSPKQVDNQWIINFGTSIGWQMYRNAKIMLVKNTLVDDSINTEAVYNGIYFGITDQLSESLKAGCWSEDIPPSARGLLFDENGNVWQKFVKNGRAWTLQEQRVGSLADQCSYTQPVISGTAELDTQFCAKREYNTTGIFLVTGLRQDLHQDTEEVTMARIANKGGFVYEYEWSDPYCVMEEAIQYNFTWGEPICAKELKPEWSFVWEKPICVTVEKKMDN